MVRSGEVLLNGHYDGRLAVFAGARNRRDAWVKPTEAGVQLFVDDLGFHVKWQYRRTINGQTSAQPRKSQPRYKSYADGSNGRLHRQLIPSWEKKPK
jgi:hypothetical protein